MRFTSEQVATLLHAPIANVRANYPLLDAALSVVLDHGYTEASEIAMLATVRVECPPFTPVRECGSEAYLNQQYDTRTDLGNTPARDGDGARYCGRGFIQLTGEINYAHYGRLIGVDLVSDPDKALEPNTAALLFALFFKEHGVAMAATLGNWPDVRKKVNGGLNGYTEFIGYVRALQEVHAQPCVTDPELGQ